MVGFFCGRLNKRSRTYIISDMTGKEKGGRPRVIGITGGIGSGKSTVGSMLRERGHVVIDADEISHDLTRKGSSVLEEIQEAFEESVIKPDGELDRAKVASIVFSDTKKRKVLEGILHPKIEAERNRLIAESGEDFVFVLIPLLYERNMQDKMDSVWVCSAPMEVRLERTVMRDGSNEHAVRKRMEAQVPDEVKVELADEVIYMSGSLDTVQRQLTELLKKLEESE